MNMRRYVVVVEDDEAHRVAIEDFVLSLGWPVLAFASPEEYLRSASVDDTSFLISDIRMPGMSGVEMYKHLIDVGSAPPAVFITAFSTPALEAEVMAIGARVLLEKPFDAAEIAYWLDLSLGQP
jgi:FixJ family two-component response regulator